MANMSLNQPEQNLETYFLIWLDAKVNSSKENIKAQQKLRTSINHLIIFEDDHECEIYIQSVPKEERIILIVSGQLGQTVVPRTHRLRQIFSIYVYCMNKEKHVKWAQKFSKVISKILLFIVIELLFVLQVKCVTVNLDELISKICSDHDERQHNKIDEGFSISMFTTSAGEEQSTTDINGHFIYSQLLINSLVRLESNLSDEAQFINLCRKQYEGNTKEIKILEEFEKTYSPSRALWWYTRQSFLYRLLNKALRVQNIDLLYHFYFFIRDIKQQLEDNKCTSSIHVYRGQMISTKELEVLKNNVGEFISINAFFSTSLNRELALSFITNADILDESERALFEIYADPQLENISPFSNITSSSYFPREQEILFMIGSIFQLIRVYRDEDGIWIVRMKLSSCNDLQLNALLEHMKNKHNRQENTLLLFCDILLKMGKFQEAEKYCHRLLKTPSSDPQCIARCYHLLGIIAMQKDELDSSLLWLKKSLEMKLQTLKADDPEVAEDYHDIGKVHRKKGEFDQAIKMFEKALVIWRKTLGNNTLKLARSYSDIGNSYQSNGNFVKALEYHEEAIKINEKHLPKYHQHLGSSHINIATTQRCLGNYELALEHGNLALEIFQKSLPSEHQKIGWVLENIGLVYEKQGKLEKSLSFLNKAANTYRQTLPITHYYIIDIERNIQRVSSQLYTR